MGIAMITSTSNSQVKEIIQINTKGKARRESGLFVTEGIRMFREAPADRIEKIYVSESFSQNKLKNLHCNCVHAHAGSQLLNDEIIFYNESAMLLNYIVEFK